MALSAARILITCDLHYNIPRSREPTERLAAEVCRQGGDALVLVGDSAGAEYDPLRRCLELFAGFGGLKLLVPGNHCLWCNPGEDSLQRYYQTLPQLCQECGFAVLDHQPQVVARAGLVGSIGWYDYSFRQESLGVPLDFYRAEVAPGAAAYFSEYRPLLDRHASELTPQHERITTRWMDAERARLGMSDEDFTERLAQRLATQMAELAGQVEQIIAFTHHVPFAELLPAARPPKWAFAAAFLGSRRLGEALLAQPKVTHAFCGHSHWAARQRVGHIEAVAVGSTYLEKRLEVLMLP